MSHPRLKLLIAAAVVLGGLGVIIWTAVRHSGLHYLEVDEFLAQPAFASQPVRLRGRVDPSSRLAVEGPRRFDLLGTTRRLTVVYDGVLPDSFIPGGRAVVEGKLAGDGSFEAHNIMTQCSSKYEPEAPR